MIEKNHMKPKVLIWDADGVLIKSKYLFSELLQQEYGIDARKMTPFFTGIFRDCGIGKADLKDELAKVVDDWGWRGSVDELLEFWLTQGTQIDEEMYSFLQTLRASGLTMFMATDNEKYRGERLRRMLQGEIFDTIFLSSELGCRKNTESFWQKVYETVKANFGEVKKEEILYIDDDQNDIATAKKFGLTTYHYSGNLSALKTFIFTE